MKLDRYLAPCFVLDYTGKKKDAMASGVLANDQLMIRLDMVNHMIVGLRFLLHGLCTDDI